MPTQPSSAGGAPSGEFVALVPPPAAAVPPLLGPDGYPTCAEQAEFYRRPDGWPGRGYFVRCVADALHLAMSTAGHVRHDVLIEKRVIGRILGRGGRDLEAMQLCTGCKVFLIDKMPPPDANDEHRLVILVGPPAAVRACRDKVDAVLERARQELPPLPPSLAYGGGAKPVPTVGAIGGDESGPHLAAPSAPLGHPTYPPQPSLPTEALPGPPRPPLPPQPLPPPQPPQPSARRASSPPTRRSRSPSPEVPRRVWLPVRRAPEERDAPAWAPLARSDRPEPPPRPPPRVPPYTPAVHDDGNGLLRPPGEAANRPIGHRVERCYAWARGACHRGDACRFSHGDAFDADRR